MPTCEQRGATYLVLLFGLALGGIALAAALPRWQAAADRELEAELAFRGGELRRALEAYAEATPEGLPRRPPSLAALLVDERLNPPRHWLRRLYADPCTGVADWQLLRDGDGAIHGVASRSARRLRRTPVPGAQPAPDRTRHDKASDWHFVAVEPEPGRTP